MLRFGPSGGGKTPGLVSPTQLTIALQPAPGESGNGGGGEGGGGVGGGGGGAGQRAQLR